MTRRPVTALILFALSAGVLLSACAKSGSPGDAVETYLKALLSGDETKVYATVCPDWEARAAVDFNAFTGVSGTFDGLSCKKSGTEGDDTLVTCAGTLRLTYNGEQRERSMAGTTYRARKIDGEWKMCGYQP